MNDERGMVLRGDEANLSVLRVAFQQGSPITQSTALEQFLDKDERILMSATQVNASLISDTDSDDIPARVMLTSERLLLWSTEEDEDNQADLVADAACIDLHAMSQESSVYIQLTKTDCQDPLEVTLSFENENEASSSQERSQALYDALSQLVSLHPIDPNETEQGQFDNGDDDMMIWAPQRESSSSSEEATEEERNSMLERLDNLLVVPPELEVQEEHQEQEGQFDDAEDDDDNDIL